METTLTLTDTDLINIWKALNTHIGVIEQAMSNCKTDRALDALAVEHAETTNTLNLIGVSVTLALKHSLG